MLESQLDLHKKIGEQWSKYREILPDVADAYDALPQEVYKDGVLTGKTKRLMALAGALIGGCRACILFQTEHALNLGATPEEILETCAVAISLGGTMAGGQTTRVVGLLEEKGLI